MSRPLLPPFRMRYREVQRGDIFTGSMLFFMFCKVIARMKHLVCTGTRRELSNIGFNDSSPMVSEASGIENILVVPLNYRNPMSKDYAMNYDGHPENLATNKICGTVPCYPSMSKNAMEQHSVFGSVKDSFTNLDLPSKGLAVSPMRQTRSDRRSLKKLPPMDERSAYAPLGRRRGSFSKTYHVDEDVGSYGPPTSGTLCLNPREDRILRCNRSHNRSPRDARSCHVQRQYIRQ